MSVKDIAILSCDRDGVILSVDDGFVKISGYEVTEIIGRKVHETILKPPYSTYFPTFLTKLSKTTEFMGFNGTIELIHKDGSCFPTKISTALIGIASRPVVILQMSKWTDVECTLVFRTNGSIISVRNAEEIFQFSDTEVKALTLDSLLPSLSFPLSPEEQAQSITSLKGVIEKEGSVLGSRKDGTRIPLDIQLEEISMKGVSGFCRAKIRKIDLEKDILFILTEEWNIKQFNAAFIKDIFDLNPQDVDGKHITHFISGFGSSSTLSQRKRKREESSFLQSNLFQHKRGGHIPVTWTLVNLQGNPLGDNGIYYAFLIRRLAQPIVQVPPSVSAVQVENPTVPTVPTSVPTVPKEAPHTVGVETIGKYRMLEKIGEGTYGIVRKAIHLDTKQEVAVKILDKSSLLEADLKRSLREIEILKKLDHPNIVKVYEIEDSPGKIYIFMEQIKGGDLLRYCLHRSAGDLALEENHVRTIFRQLVSAVAYCHSMNIIHRDIKHTNILMHGDLVKLIDFGLGNFFATDALLNTFCGSPAYAAPELLLGTKYVGPEVDVWSLGIVLFSMLVGELPFTSVQATLKCELKLPPKISRDCGDLLTKMLIVASKRCGIEEVKNHHWLSVSSQVSSEISEGDNNNKQDSA